MDNPRDSDRPPSSSEGELEIQVEKVFARPEGPDPVPSIPKTKREKISAELGQEKDLRGAGRLDFVKRSGAEVFTRAYTRATALPIPDELDVDLSSNSVENAHLGEPAFVPRLTLPMVVRPEVIATPSLIENAPSSRLPQFWPVVASLLLATMGYFLYRWVQAPRATSDSLAAASIAQKALRARQTLEAYLSAPGWEGRLEHILKPETLRGKVRGFYEDMYFTDPEWDAALPGQMVVIGTDVWYIFPSKGTGQNSGVSFRFKETASGFKLDWESLVGLGDMPWAYFCKIRPAEPKRVSVVIFPADSYIGIYADDKKWQAYELRSSGQEPVQSGYVERTSRTAQRLQKATAGKVSVPLTLLLACDPASDSSQVKILDVAPDP